MNCIMISAETVPHITLHGTFYCLFLSVCLGGSYTTDFQIVRHHLGKRNVHTEW